jgi:hypothetical protein
MSLTSLVRDTRSPVRQFLQAQFPHVDAALQPHRAEWTDIPTIPGYPYDTLGMALDYRIRYYFEAGSCQDLIAWSGAKAGSIYSGGDLLDGRLMMLRPFHEFFARLTAALDHLQPVRRRLGRPEEGLLARYCYVLALFERIRREGPERSPLLEQAVKATIEELLAMAEECWLDDLRELSWAFYDHFADLLTQPVRLNPTFEGSRDVGGADADLIVDGCLIEIKMTTQPRRLDKWRERLYQLLGYCLLDYSDEYAIREVGVYLARQHVLLRWPLDELMRTLAGGDVPSLDALRSQFTAVARAAIGRSGEGMG